MSRAGLIPALKEGNGTGSSTSKLEVHLANSKLPRQARHTAGSKKNAVLVLPKQSSSGDLWYITHCIDSHSCMPTIGTCNCYLTRFCCCSSSNIFFVLLRTLVLLTYG
jgi:hypothetical protein